MHPPEYTSSPPVAAPNTLTPCTICLCGAHLQLLAQAAIYWPEYSVLIVSDLHLEKASSYAVKTGQFLPPYDSAATLTNVEALAAKYSPKTIISLGDSFHDVGAYSRLQPVDLARIRALTATADWVWVEGNHDPIPPQDLGGRACHTLRIGPLVFRHEPLGETGEIAGHLHPSVRLKTRQGFIRRRCFAFNTKTLIMPAMGALTGGLDVSHPAFGTALGVGFELGVLTASGVVKIKHTVQNAQNGVRKGGARGRFSRRLVRP